MQQTTDSEGRLLSGWWRRALAFLLDSLFSGMLALLIAGPFTVAALLLTDSETVTMLVALVFVAVVVLAYGVALPVRYNGQTPGKKITDIRIVRIDGRPVDAKTMWVRYGLMQYAPNFLSNVFSPLAFVAVGYYLLDYLFPLWDDKRQCLHDKAAGTQVVYEPSSPEAGWYDDPDSSEKLRYFDGQAWTESYADKTAASPPAKLEDADLPEGWKKLPEKPE